MTRLMSAPNTTTEIIVWDPLVRLFHWTLVAAFCAAYFTQGEPFVPTVVLFALCTFVAWGRYRMAPIAPRA